METLLRPSERLILIVDDDQDNLNLVSKTLEYEGYRVASATSGEEALAILKSERPDLVILDVSMPGMSGLDLLTQLRLREGYISVIFLSGRSHTEEVVQGLDSGADDYVCKPFNPMELLARVRAQLRIKDLNEMLTLANKRLQELVDIDDLTGLYNMRSVYHKLQSEISRAKRHSRAVAVVMLDMDDFKQVNDTHDHLFGSYVLAEVGKIISNTIRGVDFAARYGGDEFLVALSETTVDGAQLFCERLRRLIAAHTFERDGNSMRLTASLGVAAIEPSTTSVDAKTLVRCADHSLYEAKRAGKNRVACFDRAQFPTVTTSVDLHSYKGMDPKSHEIVNLKKSS